MHQDLARRHSAFQGRIGIAREEITPPVGIYSRNWGAAKHDTAESIHRPLALTALTMMSSFSDQPLVLIEADLGWWRSLELFRQFQKRMLEELSLDSTRFIFSLTHTHASPPLMESDPALPGNTLLSSWMEGLNEAAVSVMKRALAGADEAILDWHTGRCTLAAVRDLPDPDPTVDRMICGFNPAAKADDTLLVGRITDRSGTVRATLVNYACHPTTLAWGNTAISPDYIGAMRETMETATGATAFFLQGMSGDLAPKHQYVGDVEVADRHGRQLGFAALAALNDMEPAGFQLRFDGVVESGAPLAAWRHQSCEISTELRAVEVVADLKLKEWPTADRLEQQRLACDDRAVEERLRRQRDIRRSLGDGASFPLMVNAWRIGDALLVGCAGEAYSQLQRDLRSRFPHLTVICMNLINGSVGYLPPTDLYDLDVYPVWQTPFDRGCLERLANTMVAGIEELLA
ncbi:MAG: alkaline ceramidase [Planctomycetaceae bacterium]|nr:alkaline ceramidase [Planctomycetaceae bacterium]